MSTTELRHPGLHFEALQGSAFANTLHQPLPHLLGERNGGRTGISALSRHQDSLKDILSHDIEGQLQFNRFGRDVNSTLINK